MNVRSEALGEYFDTDVVQNLRRLPEQLLQINRQNLKWAVRMALIILLVALADARFVFFARKPLPWAAVIPALIPLLTGFFVILPMMRAEKPAHPSA